MKKAIAIVGALTAMQFSFQAMAAETKSAAELSKYISEKVSQSKNDSTLISSTDESIKIVHLNKGPTFKIDQAKMAGLKANINLSISPDFDILYVKDGN